MSCVRSDRSRSMVLCAAGVLLSSCGSLSIDLPAPFLTLRTPGTEVRATTPDDARVWVREFDDHDRGDLAFWSKALENNLLARGYGHVESRSVRDATGREGQLHRFTTQHDGQAWGYLVAVFVLPGTRVHTIRTVELAGSENAFAAHADAVQAAIPTLRP